MEDSPWWGYIWGYPNFNLGYIGKWLLSGAQKRVSASSAI